MDQLSAAILWRQHGEIVISPETDQLVKRRFIFFIAFLAPFVLLTHAVPVYYPEGGQGQFPYQTYIASFTLKLGVKSLQKQGDKSVDNALVRCVLIFWDPDDYLLSGCFIMARRGFGNMKNRGRVQPFCSVFYSVLDIKSVV